MFGFLFLTYFPLLYIRQSLGPPTFLKMTQFHFFLWLRNIPVSKKKITRFIFFKAEMRNYFSLEVNSSYYKKVFRLRMLTARR